MGADTPEPHGTPRGRDYLVVGVVSDTHGMLDSCARHALAGVDHIIHAGDAVADHVLADLASIAPITAVRGNCDSGAIGEGLRGREMLELGGVRFIVAHKAKHATAGLNAHQLDGAVVVTGHTHVPRVKRVGSTLWVNPGSASRPLKGSVASVALVKIVAGHPSARIVAI